MAAQVISLSMRRMAPAPISRDWSQREIAEFYRVEAALIQAGMRLESERGISDEGDPWFAFCHADTGEVFIHFAREDGRYVVDGGPFGAAARGDDFAALVRELIGRHPLAATRRPGSNVMMHPAALLIALVGACFFHAVQAKAAETSEGAAVRAAVDHARRTGLTLAASAAPAASVEGAAASLVVALDAAQAAALLAAIAIGLREPASASGGAAPSPILSAELPAMSRPGTVEANHVPASPADHGDVAAALSLVAVLHDLFRLQTAAAPLAVPAAEAHAVAPTATPAPAVTAAPMAAEIERAGAGAPSVQPAVLVVHLTEGELPHLEAVAIVQGLSLLKLLSVDHIDRVDHLPSAILNAIAQGEQVDLAHQEGFSALPAVRAPVDATDHAVTAPGLDHSSDLDAHTATPAATAGEPHATNAPPPVDPGSAPQTSPPPPADASVLAGGAGAVPPPAPQLDPPPPAAQPPVPLSELLAPAQPLQPLPPPPPAFSTPQVVSHSDSIDSLVLKFTVLVGGHPGLIVSGHEIVLYDPQIYSSTFQSQPLDAITFNFDDGSSLSLVGTKAELHDLHGTH